MKTARTSFDVVLVAASYGAHQSLPILLSGIPEDFPAAILIAYHVRRPASFMVELLQKTCALPVRWATEGEPVTPGRVVLAAPDYHLTIRPDQTLSCNSLRVWNFVRPSADVLFQSAAEVWRERCVAAVLSGMGRDGALGARAIKNAGGRVLAEHPSSCASFAMPQAAIETGAVDFVLSVQRLASAIVSLVTIPGVADLFRVSPDFALSHAYQYRSYRYPTDLPSLDRSS